MGNFRSWMMVTALLALQGSIGCNCCCSPKQSKSPAFNPGPMGSAAVPTSTTPGQATTGRVIQPGSTTGSTDALTPGTMPRAGGVATNAGMVNMTSGSASDPVKSWDVGGTGTVTQTSAVAPQTPTSGGSSQPVPAGNKTPGTSSSGQSGGLTGANTLPPTPDLPANTSSRYVPVSTTIENQKTTPEINPVKLTSPAVPPPTQPINSPPAMPMSENMNTDGKPKPPETSILPVNPTVPVTPVEPTTPPTIVPQPPPMPPG